MYNNFRSDLTDILATSKSLKQLAYICDLYSTTSSSRSSGGRLTINLFSKLNNLFFGWFDLVNDMFHNETKRCSGWPNRCVDWITFAENNAPAAVVEGLESIWQATGVENAAIPLLFCGFPHVSFVSLASNNAVSLCTSSFVSAHVSVRSPRKLVMDIT